MNKLTLTIALVAFVTAISLFGQQQTVPAPSAPTTSTMSDQQKTSYSIGLNIGLNLYEQDVKVDFATLTKGIRDGLANSKPALSEEEIRTVLTKLQKEVADKQLARRKVQGDKNLKDAEAYLAQNKTKQGVVTLPSGLQYKIITEGKGPKPAATDTVVTHYKGTFLDGKQFDSSYDRNEPVSFAVNGVIKGWTEALQLMTVGSKWQLFVPPNLAYGENGYQSVIPPNAALIFDIELVSIQPPAEKK